MIFFDANKILNTHSIHIKRNTANSFDANVFDVDISRDPQVYTPLYSLSVLNKPTALDALGDALVNLKGTANFSGLKCVNFQIVDDIITQEDFEMTLDIHLITVNVRTY